MPTNTPGTTFQGEAGLPPAAEPTPAWKYFVPGLGEYLMVKDLLSASRAGDPVGVGLSGLGLLPFAGSIGSSFSRNANRFKYELAKRDLAKGAAPAEVEATHGILTGLGGDVALRHEISDAGTRLKVPLEELLARKQGLPFMKQGDVIDAPGLFEAHPEARNSLIDFTNKMARNTKGSLQEASTIPGDVRSYMKINTVYPWRNSEDLLGTLLHENTHNVQEASRFARGGNVPEAEAAMRRAQSLLNNRIGPYRAPQVFSYARPEEVYLAKAGEVEARTVQQRLPAWLKGKPGEPFSVTRQRVLGEAQSLPAIAIGKGKELTAEDILKALVKSDYLTFAEKELILQALGFGRKLP